MHGHVGVRMEECVSASFSAPSVCVRVCVSLCALCATLVKCVRERDSKEWGVNVLVRVRACHMSAACARARLSDGNRYRYLQHSVSLR